MSGKMNKYTLLGVPSGNLKELIKESLSDLNYEVFQLLHFFIIDVQLLSIMRQFSDLTDLSVCCVHFALPFPAHPLTYHSIFTTKPVKNLI